MTKERKEEIRLYPSKYMVNPSTVCGHVKELLSALDAAEIRIKELTTEVVNLRSYLKQACSQIEDD